MGVVSNQLRNGEEVGWCHPGIEGSDFLDCWQLGGVDGHGQLTRLALLRTAIRDALCCVYATVGGSTHRRPITVGPPSRLFSGLVWIPLPTKSVFRSVEAYSSSYFEGCSEVARTLFTLFPGRCGYRNGQVKTPYGSYPFRRSFTEWLPVCRLDFRGATLSSRYVLSISARPLANSPGPSM